MVMRRKRILLLPLLAVTLMSGTAVAAPGDPYVVYTANSFSNGAVILRTEPGTGSLGMKVDPERQRITVGGKPVKAEKLMRDHVGLYMGRLKDVAPTFASSPISWG